MITRTAQAIEIRIQAERRRSELYVETNQCQTIALAAAETVISVVDQGSLPTHLVQGESAPG